MTRRLKDLLIRYVRIYARRALDSSDPAEAVNRFDTKKAAEAAVTAALKSPWITENEKARIKTEAGRKQIEEFFDEKLVINYFMMARGISYHEAKSLITDKGTGFFEETRGISRDRYREGRYRDYRATERQKEYIRSFGAVIKHEDELSGREASLIISCLKRPGKTKPAYYTYYIEAK